MLCTIAQIIKIQLRTTKIKERMTKSKTAATTLPKMQCWLHL